VARQRDTREKSQLGRHITHHASLEIDHEEGVLPRACEGDRSEFAAKWIDLGEALTLMRKVR